MAPVGGKTGGQVVTQRGQVPVTVTGNELPAMDARLCQREAGPRALACGTGVIGVVASRDGFDREV